MSTQNRQLVSKLSDGLAANTDQSHTCAMASLREKVVMVLGKINVSELARDLDVPRETLNGWVNNGREPSVVDALKLARRLRVSPYWLFDESAGLDSIQFAGEPEDDDCRITLDRICGLAQFLANDPEALHDLYAVALDHLHKQLDNSGNARSAVPMANEASPRVRPASSVEGRMGSG